jgi:tetratricopeptide (TPR) repeat protein
MSNAAAERWHATCELFHQLSELDDPARLKQLVEIGSTDPEMRDAVEALLAGDDAAHERLAPLTIGISDVLHRNLRMRPPAVVDPLQLVGRTVSHFRIIEPIAAGGMGIVYRAHDTRLGRDVALKLPLASQQIDARGRARFLMEAHAAGALDHPNLCSVYEVGESDGGRLFLAMALYAGESLKSRIAREGPLAVGDALDIARQVALGLAFAHDAGVIHRDLKPGNVMLLPDGTAKILDFGLAKLADLGDTTSHAGGLGTAGYMAPEQVRGQAVDARADLWSLGVLLYEMLTAVRPFRGDDVVSISHAILNDDVPRPSTLQARLPRAVDDLVVALLRKDREHRYASAHHVAADLDAIQRGARLRFRRGIPSRASVWLRTRPRRVKAAVAALAVGIVLAAPTVARFARPLLVGRPTQNADAYEFYLRGREYERTGPMAAADTLYRRALALDSGFALARARLALVQITYTLRPEEARLEQGRKEAAAALRTQPALGDAHFALGLYWQRRNAHDRALAEFAKAGNGVTEPGAFHAALGLSYRSLGRWEEAVAELERALQLDPRNIVHAPTLALTYTRLRRYRETARTWSRYIALTPDAYTYMLIKGYTFTRWQGTSDTLAAALERIPPDWDGRGMATFARVYVARLRRRPADAVAALAASRQTVSEDEMVYRPHSLLRGMAYDAAGDPATARAHYDTARAMMEDSVTAHPNDPRLYIALGMSLAGLGRREDAISSARQAMALAPISADIARATCFMGGAAEILAFLGEKDAAIRLLDRLLQMPAGREASVPLLRVDPAYDRLRDDPRFEQMLQRYATN